MQNSDARVVRGLAIAVIIINALALAALVIGAIFLALGGFAWNDPELQDSLVMQLNNDPEFISAINESGFTSGEMLGLMNIVFALGGVAIAAGAVLVLLALIAGIIALRNVKHTEKLGKVFGWSIVGIVVSALSTKMICLVLFIIMTVYVNRLKKMPAIPMGQQVPVYAQNAYGQPYQQQMYQQPMYGQPAQTPAYGQPNVQPGYTPQPQPMQPNMQQAQVQPQPQQAQPVQPTAAPAEQQDEQH